MFTEASEHFSPPSRKGKRRRAARLPEFFALPLRAELSGSCRRLSSLIGASPLVLGRRRDAPQIRRPRMSFARRTQLSLLDNLDPHLEIRLVSAKERAACRRRIRVVPADRDSHVPVVGDALLRWSAPNRDTAGSSTAFIPL